MVGNGFLKPFLLEEMSKKSIKEADIKLNLTSASNEEK
jgi:hypothetical protein